MDNFLRNYWSLYLNFINAFKRWSYKGFSIPYLCHLHAFVLYNKKIMNGLLEKKFINKSGRQVELQKKLPEFFFRIIGSYIKAPSINSPLRIGAVHLTKPLRFPSNALVKYLNSTKNIKLIIVDDKEKNIKNKSSLSTQNHNSLKKLKSKKIRSVSLTSNIVLNRKHVQKKRIGESNEVLQDIRLI
ncbi:MAG: hypothetical protein WAM07_16305 [Halobacillus sp.]|uniref:hypothetical protein n=1 Tax=Halobacillus sp. TaxID=56800 RepID=UPI003BB08409